MKLACVVVWYNPSKKEKENIKTYLKYVDKLYIVDNSEYKNEFSKNKKVKYIFNGDNLGIAFALNIGAKEAIKDKFDWLLTMDQDTSFKNDDVKKIFEFIQENDMKNIGIVSPWHDTKLHIKKPKEKIDYPIDVMTSGNFLNLKIYQKIGGFKEEYFIDGVDIEYCLRLKKYNYKVMRLNNYSIKHNLGNICYKHFFKKELLCLNHNYLRVYYRVRNYNYIKQEYQQVAPEFCNILVKIKALIWCIIFYEDDKLKKLKSIYYAKKDFKHNIYGKYNH